MLIWNGTEWARMSPQLDDHKQREVWVKQGEAGDQWVKKLAARLEVKPGHPHDFAAWREVNRMKMDEDAFWVKSGLAKVFAGLM